MVTGLLLLVAAAFGAQEDKAVEEALEAFKVAVRSTSEADRVTAINELAKIHHQKTLARLASFLSNDGPTVRIAAAKGIAGFVEMKKHAASVLVAALGVNAKETTVHSGLYEAIGKLEEPTSLPSLHHGFDEKETVVAKSAVQATGQVGSVSSIEPLIAFLTKLEKLQKSAGGSVDYTAPIPGAGAGASVTVRSDDTQGKRAQELIPAVNKALNEITHESNGTSETWNAWWAKNKGSFKGFK